MLLYFVYYIVFLQVSSQEIYILQVRQTLNIIISFNKDSNLNLLCNRSLVNSPKVNPRWLYFIYFITNIFIAICLCWDIMGSVDYYIIVVKKN